VARGTAGCRKALGGPREKWFYISYTLSPRPHTGRVPIVWAGQANGGCSAATPMEMTSACIGHDVVATAADTGRPLDFAWPQGRSNLWRV
jgi:hypothetical protein